jgi:hypothetical protein
MIESTGGMASPRTRLPENTISLGCVEGTSLRDDEYLRLEILTGILPETQETHTLWRKARRFCITPRLMADSGTTGG